VTSTTQKNLTGNVLHDNMQIIKNENIELSEEKIEKSFIAR